jgi:hypothetical protein
MIPKARTKPISSKGINRYPSKLAAMIKNNKNNNSTSNTIIIKIVHTSLYEIKYSWRLAA